MTGKAWHYSFGQWTGGPDPVNDVWGDSDDQAGVMKTLGYDHTHTIGNADYGTSIEVWKRQNLSPRYVLFLTNDSIVEHVYVDALPDVWDLLARWSPVVRDEAITELINGISHGEQGLFGVVETIARRASWGAQQRYDLKRFGS